MITEKQKGMPVESKRFSVVVLEGLILLVAIVMVFRFLFPSIDEPDVSFRSVGDIYENALLALNNKNYELALTDFTQAITAGYEPLTNAYFNRARAYYNLQNYAAALEDYDQAIALDPACEYECHVNYHNRAWVYNKLNQFDEAIADFTQAITLKSDYALAYRSRGLLYLNAELPYTGLRDLQKAFELAQTSLIQRGVTDYGGQREAEITSAGMQIRFTFQGKAGQYLTARVTESELDLMMLLLDDDMNPLEFDDDSGDNLNPLIERRRLTCDCVYSIVLSAYDFVDVGSFTLDIQLN